MSYLVTYRKGKPLRRIVLFAWLAGLYTAAMVVSLAGVTRLVSPSPEIRALLFCLAWFGPMVAMVPLLTQTLTRWGWVIFAWLFGGVLTAAPFFFAQDSLLAFWGIRQDATVIDVQGVEDNYALYTLQNSDGSPMPGLLRTYDRYAGPGDTVTVVADPASLVHPVLASDIQGTAPQTGIVTMTVLFGLQLMWCWLAAEPRRDPLNVSTTAWMQPGSGNVIIESLRWWQIGFGAVLALLGLVLMLIPGPSLFAGVAFLGIGLWRITIGISRRND